MSGEAKVLCHYCRTELIAGATYCANCKQFQRWWDQVRAQVKVQDVIAVVSVATLAVTTLWGALKFNVVNPHADVRATVLECRADSVQMAMTNLGTRDAFIKTGAAARQVGKAPDIVPDRRLITGEQPLLKAGETRTVWFKIEPALPAYATDAARLNCRLGLAFTVFEFNSPRRNVTSFCGCPEVND
jgi:hypothetical protein